MLKDWLKLDSGVVARMTRSGVRSGCHGLYSTREPVGGRGTRVEYNPWHPARSGRGRSRRGRSERIVPIVKLLLEIRSAAR